MHLRPLFILTMLFVASVARAQIFFPDPNVERAVRSAIGKSSGPISSNDLAGLTTLVDDRAPVSPQFGFSNLSGLEAATNLQSLILVRSPLTNYAALASMLRVSFLIISSSTISNLSFAASMSGLTTLVADGCRIQDVSPLAGHPTLATCQLGLNPITNLHEMANIPGLQRLAVPDVPVSDISFLVGATQLSSLEMGSRSVPEQNPVTDLSVLTNLPLRTLTIHQGSPTNWSVLRELDLTSLTIDHPFSPLPPTEQFIRGLPGYNVSLNELRLFSAGTVNLAPLTNALVLFFLTVADSPVVDFSPISGMLLLAKISLPGTGLRDTRYFTNLEPYTLNIDSNPITNWTALPPTLQELHVQSTGLSNLNVLTGLTELRDIHAASNHITDLTLPTGFNYLRFLNFAGNTISNVTPLLAYAPQLPYLKSVIVDDNYLDLNTGTPARTSLDQLRTNCYVQFLRQRYQPRLQTTITPSGDAFKVLLSYDACPGLSYDIERTTNFVDWTAVGSINVLRSEILIPNHRLNLHLANDQPPGNFYFRLAIHGFSN